VSGVAKDLALMRATAARLGLDLPSLNAAFASFSEAEQSGRGGEDLIAMVPHRVAALLEDQSRCLPGAGAQGGHLL
jgi:hypothetical protein